MNDKDILAGMPEGAQFVDEDGCYIKTMKDPLSGVVDIEANWGEGWHDIPNHVFVGLRSIADIEKIVALEAEIESLKAQLEAQSKIPSHWDTAPEGAVKLVGYSGLGITRNYYVNDSGEIWVNELNNWNKDPDPHGNTLLEERTL